MEQNNGQRSFRKTSGSVGEAWNVQATEANGFAYDANNEKNNTMDGYLVDVNHGVGMHSATVWKLHEVLEDGTLGQIWSIWGDTALNGEMEKEKLGSFVRVVYKGKKAPKGKPELTQAQWTKGNSYHMWEVFVDDNAIPYNKANPGATIRQAPEKQQPTAQNNAQGNQQQNNAKPVVNSRGGGGNNAVNQQQQVNNNSRSNGGGNQNNKANNNAGAFADDDLPF